MRAGDFDELAFFRAVGASGAKALGTSVHMPSIDDLILTKRFGSRPKDLEDIRLLRILRGEQTS